MKNSLYDKYTNKNDNRLFYYAKVVLESVKCIYNQKKEKRKVMIEHMTFCNKKTF